MKPVLSATHSSGGYTATRHFLRVLAFGTMISLHAEPLTTAAANQGVQLAVSVQEADAERGLHVGEVISSRRYVLRNSRWPNPAVMHARMISTPGHGKRFEVVSMEHAGGLQKRVFMQVLAGEVGVSVKKLNTKGSDTDASLSARNYDFAFLGSDIIEGRHCAVLQLIPKRKSKYLINGKAWVDIEAAAIVRIEGHTAASVSFWVGKPAVTQHFRKVDELWLPSSNRSVSDVRFLGDTELTIEYLSYKIARPEVKVAAGYSPASGEGAVMKLDEEPK